MTSSNQPLSSPILSPNSPFPFSFSSAQVLAANAAGTAVILTNHSNCERGFLPVYAAKFTAALAALGGDAAAAPAGGGAGGSGGAAPLAAADVECIVSAVDADPLVTV